MYATCINTAQYYRQKERAKKESSWDPACHVCLGPYSPGRKLIFEWIGGHILAYHMQLLMEYIM